MRDDRTRVALALVSLLLFAAAVTVASVVELRRRWLADLVLIGAGVAVGPAVVIVGDAFGDDGDHDRAANVVLAVSYVAFVAVSAYNAFVLDFVTGLTRGLTMVVIGLMGLATLLAIGRAVGAADPTAGG